MRQSKRTVCLGLVALLLACGWGCGPKEQSDPGKDVDVAALAQAMMDADPTLPEMVTVAGEGDKGGKGAADFSYLSNLEVYKLVDAYCYAAADAGTAEEIAVVKLKDAGDAAALMDALHKHVEQRQGTFREYDPSQVPLTEGAVIVREGRYVALIVCQKSGLVQNVFRDSFREN